MKVLHERYNIEAMNTRLHRLANKTIDRLAQIREETVFESRDLDDYGLRDHCNWPRLIPRIDEEQPEPRYTQRNPG